MSIRRPNMTPNKTPMAVQPLPQRMENNAEVALGYTLAQAQREAERCLNCPDRYCSMHCPAHNYIPEFIAQIRLGDLEAAWELLSHTNPMMEISGRVCPYECQCESHCTRGIKSQPVAIGYLERFVADWHRANQAPDTTLPEPHEERVAVVGGGPAGLTCAYSLAKSGFQVTIFEKENRLGGTPVWGIPSFVMPQKLMDYQIAQLQHLGVSFKLNTTVGEDITVEALQNEFDAVFIATGATKPVELTIPGAAHPAVVQARDYLSNPEAYPAQRVLIIGGGNTAIDAARVARRQGAQANIVYRRTTEDMPATRDEQALAQEEGAVIMPLLSPASVLADGENITALRCDKMVLTAPDYPGGRNNVAPSGEQQDLPCDLIVLALGFRCMPIEGLPVDTAGRIIVDKHLCVTERVYAGGDAVTGAATLMKASAAGKDAATEIYSSLLELPTFNP